MNLGNDHECAITHERIEGKYESLFFEKIY